MKILNIYLPISCPDGIVPLGAKLHWSLEPDCVMAILIEEKVNHHYFSAFRSISLS